MSFLKKLMGMNGVHRLALSLTAAIYMAIFYGLFRLVVLIERNFLGQG